MTESFHIEIPSFQLLLITKIGLLVSSPILFPPALLFSAPQLLGVANSSAEALLLKVLLLLLLRGQRFLPFRGPFFGWRSGAEDVLLTAVAEVAQLPTLVTPEKDY